MRELLGKLWEASRELLRGAPSRRTYDGSIGALKVLNLGAPKELHLGSAIGVEIYVLVYKFVNMYELFCMY